MSNETEKKIAAFMLDLYLKRNRLSQSVAVMAVRKAFGDGHTYRNRNGNHALNAGILEAFRKLTPSDVVWSRSKQEWRARKPTDPPESRMVR